MVNETIKGYSKLTNQSQFRDKLKDYGFDKNSWESARRIGLLNYPTEYPCLCKVTRGYHGFDYPVVSWLTLKDLDEMKELF